MTVGGFTLGGAGGAGGVSLPPLGGLGVLGVLGRSTLGTVAVGAVTAGGSGAAGTVAVGTVAVGTETVGVSGLDGTVGVGTVAVGTLGVFGTEVLGAVAVTPGTAGIGILVERGEIGSAEGVVITDEPAETPVSVEPDVGAAVPWPAPEAPAFVCGRCLPPAGFTFAEPGFADANGRALDPEVAFPDGVAAAPEPCGVDAGVDGFEPVETTSWSFVPSGVPTTAIAPTRATAATVALAAPSAPTSPLIHEIAGAMLNAPSTRRQGVSRLRSSSRRA